MANESGENGEPASLPLAEQLLQLQQERDSLQRRVKELEEEQGQVKQKLAAVQEERDVYLHEVYALLRKQASPEEDYEFFKNLREEDCISGAELLAELDQMIAEYQQSRTSSSTGAS